MKSRQTREDTRWNEMARLNISAKSAFGSQVAQAASAKKNWPKFRGQLGDIHYRNSYKY